MLELNLQNVTCQPFVLIISLVYQSASIRVDLIGPFKLSKLITSEMILPIAFVVIYSRKGIAMALCAPYLTGKI